MSDAVLNTWLPPPLRTAAGRVLEVALNRVIALDPGTMAGLKDLECCRVQLHLRGPELALVIHVQGGRLKVEPPHGAADASLRLSTSPGGALGMALAGTGAAVPGKVEIAGDAELARRLEKLARGYAPDIEEVFAHRFGDVIGVPLARTLNAALSHVRESGQHFAEDAADWVREEARLAVPTAEMDDFLDAVDTLRERTERLEARLGRLAARRSPAT